MTTDTLPSTPVQTAATGGQTSSDPASRWSLGIGPQATPVHFVATLGEACGEGAWLVQVGGRSWRATQAFSCLVQPQPLDRVAGCLVEGAEGDECHVLAILSRPVPGATQLCVAGDLVVAAAGSIQVKAGQALEVSADSARFVHRAVHLVAKQCSAFLEEVRTVGESLSSVFKRERHQCEEHMRQVEGIDLLNAQIIDHRAQDLLQLRGDNVLANGSTLIKMQGSQIHFG